MWTLTLWNLSIFFVKIFHMSIRHNFPPSKFCAIRYIAELTITDTCIAKYVNLCFVISLPIHYLDSYVHMYHTVKSFGGKKVWWKDCYKGLVKKLWWMLTCINNHQSSINGKTKPNKLIPNINEHNKINSIFSEFVLCHMLVAHVACRSMMARHTVESMVCGYHEYISKLLLESELDL